MPKELTHLLISAEVLIKVEERSLSAAAILNKNRDLFMLASLIPDTAYYHIPIFNKKKSIVSLSQIIHSDRGDLNKEVITRLAQNQRELKPDEHFAFLCGLLSHQIADRAFHPLIVYLTGDYHDNDECERHFAQARHRFLEGLIDLHLIKNLNPDIKLKRDGKVDIKREKTILYPLLLSLVCAAMPQLEDKRAQEVALTLFKVSGFQLGLIKLYDNIHFRRIILAINRLFHFKFSGYAAMLYPATNNSNLPLLAQKISYLEPFNGEKHEEAIFAIKEKAISSLTGAIVDCHNAKGDLSEAITPYFHPSSEKAGRPKFMNTTEIDKALKMFLGMEHK